MDVAHNFRLRQSIELSPVPFCYGTRPDLQSECPILGSDPRRRPCGQDREVRNEMLARRNTVRLIRNTLSAGKAARDHHNTSFPASTGALERESPAERRASVGPP